MFPTGGKSETQACWAELESEQMNETHASDSSSNPTSRRSVILGVTGIIATSLAGCLGDDGESSYYDGETFLEEDEEPDYDGYLEDVSYPGTVDWTGEERVTVAVGTGREGMGYAPRSARIEAGTTVVWEWTGEGGRHDVADTDAEFASEETAEAGYTFEHTFEETGTYTYFCTPHEHRGMKGGLEVVEGR